MTIHPDIEFDDRQVPEELLGEDSLGARKGGEVTRIVSWKRLRGSLSGTSDSRTTTNKQTMAKVLERI